MKIIFLDIDGVLNSLTGIVGNDGSYKPNGLSKESIGLLKFVIAHTDARIVISSTWRIGKSIDWFIGLFEAYGLHKPPVIGLTPSSKPNDIRGDQINRWLSNKPDIEKYICIDDDFDFYKDQNLIKTDFVKGFQLYDALRCIDILGNINKKTDKSIKDLKLHIGNYDERILLDSNSIDINSVNIK